MGATDMGFGFGKDFIVNGKIKDRLKKDFPGLFNNDELDLAANKFCDAATTDDLDGDGKGFDCQGTDSVLGCLERHDNVLSRSCCGSGLR